MMINKIVEALKKRPDLAGWTVRHVRTLESQVYAVPQGIEAQRAVNSERYLIDVLRNTQTAEGSPAMGSGDASLLPGDDIGHAIDQATLVAGLVANPIYGLPGPTALPNVALCDTDLQKDAPGVILEVMERMRAAVAKHPDVRLSAAECFGEITNTHLVNSRGIDAEQESTQVDIEMVLHSGKGEHESETFDEMTRRRVSDLDLDAAIEDRVRYTLDSFEAEAPAPWQGPVVLRNEALAIFMAGDHLSGSVIQTLGSAEAKYSGFSPWAVGKPVFRGDVKGDPLTVWANRCLPFGSASDRFDAEGLPAQRIELIHENEFVAFAASQRYADYLQIPATGAFGNIELPPGRTPASDLLDEPYVEIVHFSWFNPNPITGDFATEIRFGYLVQHGLRKPFKGGQLLGNYMDALANVRWSAETGFFGSYLGPQTARFTELKIAGIESK
jgi:predicted Zn-dependent protease